MGGDRMGQIGGGYAAAVRGGPNQGIGQRQPNEVYKNHSSDACSQHNNGQKRNAIEKIWKRID